MLGPIENWQEYQWRVVDIIAAAGAPFDWSTKAERVWRITLTGLAGGGTVSFSSSGTITLAEDETIVLEPRGMWPSEYPITVDGAHATIETIRRIVAL